MKPALIYALALLSFGCASTTVPPSKAIRAYSGPERPDAELATVMESDDVWVTKLDTQSLPGSEKPLTSQNIFDMRVTYAISPGKHSLMVEYQGVAGTTPVFSYNDRAIEFYAEAGHRYSFKSNIAFFHPFGLQDEHWCPAVYDETSKKVVGQASPASDGGSQKD